MPEERKLVTILFADVTGSTSLGESLDPEDVRALMGRYYAHARHVVANHGGTIEKFIGDAVVAIFGLPQAHDDDAERALVAAIALREAIAADEILGEGFMLRMGINTGEVVATSDPSSGDFLVTGDAVNVAARLQQHASPGEIVAGERTASACRGARRMTFVFDEPRLVEVKGKRLPLQVFPLKSVRTERKVDRSPLVGRKQDLMQMSLLQTRVVEEQRPQLISIVAPAGTGKTRLLEEFLSRLDSEDGFQTAMVRCLPYGQTLTYWPLRGLLNGLLLGEEIARPRIMSIFTQEGYKLEDAARLSDLVLATLGIEGDVAGIADRESIFTAWRLLIEAFAQQAPRILVFEDLHWASDSLLDLVEHIINVRTHAQLLLIVLSRPELLDRRPTWGGGRQNFTAIALQPLSAAQTQDLVKRLAADMPEATRKQIVERSGGNPFFALELLRGLTERGQAGEAATFDVLPDTVHAALLARLDLLSRQERAVLQVASVASRSIRAPMLRTVLEDYSLHEVDVALDGLLQRDMIVPAEGDAFTFRHILIRDVAYGTLSRSERIRVHGKIAEWLEMAAGDHLDEYAELIAYHYREAVLLGRQSAVPKAMPHETQRAVHFLERAGELASRSGAFAEATSYLQNAINLAPESEHMLLYEKLGDSLVWGDIVAEGYHKALERWRASKAEDLSVGVRLLRKLLFTYLRKPVTKELEYEELDKLRAEAQKLAEEASAEDELWLIRAASISLLKKRGNITAEEVKQGRAVCGEAVEYFEQRGVWPFLNIALDIWAGYSWMVGAHTEALEASKRRLTIPELPMSERGDASNMITVSYFLQGDYDHCIAHTQETLAGLRPGEPIEYLAMGTALATWATYITGRWSETTGLLHALGEAWERVQHQPGTGMVLFSGYMAAFLLALAREDRPAIDAAVSVLERIRPNDARARDILTALREDDVSKLAFEKTGDDFNGLFLMFFSERGFHAPDKWLATSLFRDDLTTWCLKIAKALAAGDDAQIAETIDEAEAHHLVVHAARMRIVLAQRTKDRAQLERARSVLEQLGDRQFLRRLEEVEAVLAS